MTESGSGPGLRMAREKMTAAGVHPLAIDVFAHHYRQLERGETGMIPESTIEPLDMPALADAEVGEEAGVRALRETAVVKLNGGGGPPRGQGRGQTPPLRRPRGSLPHP